MDRIYKILFSLTFFFLCHGVAFAEDGSSLWLRYTSLDKTQVSSDTHSPTIAIARSELEHYGTLSSVKLVIDKGLPSEGFRILAKGDGAEIRASQDIGLLYGAYALLRQQQTSGIRNLRSAPRFSLRLLNHWDNLDGSVERGYAGKSLWKWEEIDGQARKMSRGVEQRVVQYCRANASLGINGSVLNNVNASPKILSPAYLDKVAVLAAAMRPYGIRTFLSVNFASPMALGETDTADPLDSRVQQWWRDKVSEIYAKIPDFGGFLVKANSEGQPGPGDYGRTHADGANMLAAALEPYGGIVMWRSFVYGANHKGEDRVKQAVSEFLPMDGQFRRNVILQSKNGPLDFQPREPYAPIFDQMTQTPQMAELQITQEYLGQSRHLVYLAPMWREFFSYVAPSKLVGIAGVANIGLDKNWCGHHFSQANWYAFGRLAWNPSMKSEEIANEWLAATFGLKEKSKEMNEKMLSVMLRSREACVDYMMPLGLHHIFRFDHHYGPQPDGFIKSYPLEWCPVYYHQADKNGIGFDRSHTGSNATSQYREPYCSLYDDPSTCPENLLLWFHHLPWTYRTYSGRTLWEEMKYRYNRGVSEVKDFCRVWQECKPYIDEQRWEEVDKRMQHQLQNAREWRDVCLKYFGSFAE